MDTVALKDQTKSCNNWSSNWTKGTNIKSNNLYHVIYMPSCSPLSSFEEKNFVHVFAFDLVLCYFFRATVHTQVFRLTREFLHKRSTRCVLCICRSENKIFLWVLLCSCFQNIMNIIAVVEKKTLPAIMFHTSLHTCLLVHLFPLVWAPTFCFLPTVLALRPTCSWVEMSGWAGTVSHFLFPVCLCAFGCLALLACLVPSAVKQEKRLSSGFRHVL